MAVETVSADGQALSQSERVLDAFVAPSKTFTDVRRNASWWLPFLLIVITSYILTGAIQAKVGWPQLVDNEVQTNPKLSDRLSSLTPDQVATQKRVMRYSFQGSFYASPLLNLAFVAVAALFLWPTINFGFGGSATYGRVFCVGMYAVLPGAISALLAALMLFAGRSPESFTTQTMLGSNPGYYLSTPGAMKTLLSSFDVFTLWTAVLFAIGLSIVAGTKRSAGYIAVFGWFVLIVVFRTALAAVNS